MKGDGGDGGGGWGVGGCSGGANGNKRVDDKKKECETVLACDVMTSLG